MLKMINLMSYATFPSKAWWSCFFKKEEEEEEEETLPSLFSLSC